MSKRNTTGNSSKKWRKNYKISDWKMKDSLNKSATCFWAKTTRLLHTNSATKNTHLCKNSATK